MEYDAEKREIIFFDKTVNEIDKLMIDFTNIAEDYTDYVIVSGYVSILLGRTRATEDIDLLVPRLPLSQFTDLFNVLIKKGYECANSMVVEDAYSMMDDFGIRFFKKGEPKPNIEFKMIKNDLDRYSFENRIKVIINDKILYISPLELQIAYKLFLAADGTDEELSSDKDIEDAKHLYVLFKSKINKDELLLFMDKLKVFDKFKWLEKNES